MRNSGFTLVELLIGIGIFSIIVLIVSLATRDAFRALNESRAQQALLTETRQAVEQSTDLARHAAQIMPTYINTAGVTYASDATTLILELPSYDTNGEQIPGTYDTVIIDCALPTVTLETDAPPSSRRNDRSQTLTAKASACVFRYFAPDPTTGDETELTSPALFATAKRIEFELTTEENLVNHTLSSTLIGAAQLRNAL